MQALLPQLLAQAPESLKGAGCPRARPPGGSKNSEEFLELLSLLPATEIKALNGLFGAISLGFQETLYYWLAFAFQSSLKNPVWLTQGGCACPHEWPYEVIRPSSTLGMLREFQKGPPPVPSIP